MKLTWFTGDQNKAVNELRAEDVRCFLPFSGPLFFRKVKAVQKLTITTVIDSEAN